MTGPFEYRNDPQSHYLVTTLRTTDDLYLLTCGNERHNPEWRMHSLVKGYHVHIILSGKGYLELDGTVYHLQRGQIFLLPDGAEVTYYSDGKDPWHYVWIAFSGNKTIDLLEKCGLGPSSPVRDCIFEPETFSAVIDQIISFHEMTLYNEMLRASLLFQVLALLIRSRQEAQEKKAVRHDYSPNVYIEHAKNYIYLNYDKITVADIARNLGISQSYLSHIFKERTGRSLQSYLLGYRLAQAAKLLCGTDYSIQQIAKQVGYEDQFTFTKRFKDRYRVSPTQYRKNAMK